MPSLNYYAWQHYYLGGFWFLPFPPLLCHLLCSAYLPWIMLPSTLPPPTGCLALSTTDVQTLPTTFCAFTSPLPAACQSLPSPLFPGGRRSGRKKEGQWEEKERRRKETMCCDLLRSPFLYYIILEHTPTRQEEFYFGF